jgi:acetyltransferase-like isoleucine patch superfamily enzyme
MADIVIFGTASISEVAKFYIEKYSEHRIVGFTVDRAYWKAESFLGLPVVPWDAIEQRFPPTAVKLLGPLSYQRLNELRRDRHVEGKARGYGFATFVHPGSHVETSDIGENCLILENNVIQPFVQIGDGVIIWTGCFIGYRSTLGDYCFLSAQAGLGDYVKLGKRSFLAGRAAVESRVEVGETCFLDTGVLIRTNLPAESVVRSRGSRVSRYRASRLKNRRFR